MFKGNDDMKNDAKNRATEVRPFENERFNRQIEFVLEADKLKKIHRRTTLLDR